MHAVATVQLLPSRPQQTNPSVTLSKGVAVLVTDIVTTLFTTTLVLAKAHEYVDAHELEARALVLGIDLSPRQLRKVLFEAGHPCYAGKGGRPVIMGVQFK